MAPVQVDNETRALNIKVTLLLHHQANLAI